MSDITTKLLRLKKRVDDTQRRMQSLEGERRALLRRLKTEFKCGTVKEARAMLADLAQSMNVAERQLGKDLARMEKTYDIH